MMAEMGEVPPNAPYGVKCKQSPDRMHSREQVTQHKREEEGKKKH